MLFEPNERLHIFIEGRLLGNRAHPVFDMFSNCQFSFSLLDFWSGNFFLIEPFPEPS